MSRLDRDCERALRAAAPLPLTARVTASRDWASALFTGTRLTLDLDAGNDDDVFDAWLAEIGEIALPLRGYFVADAEVTARSAGAATVELLAIEEV